MWHAFDIIANGLELPPGLRNAHADGACRMVYTERVVRWFKDKSGKGQWPAVVDERPGIVLKRTPAPADRPDEWSLSIEHTRQQSVPVTMRAEMTCASNVWRSPRRWDVVQTVEKSTLGETTEQGAWDGSEINRQIRGGRGTRGKAGRAIEYKHKAQHPASVYPLLADFPAKELQDSGLADLRCDALFTEALQHMGEAAFASGAPGNAGGHRLADGLTCYRLTPSLGFPLEFWVNRHHVVVYLIESATRAWMLESVEALS